MSSFRKKNNGEGSGLAGDTHATYKKRVPLTPVVVDTDTNTTLKSSYASLLNQEPASGPFRNPTDEGATPSLYLLQSSREQ